MIAPSGIAQRLQPDRFIAAIEDVKHSLGAMDCLAVSVAEAKLLKRTGSAFLISDSGDFVTAAHVLMDMQNSGDPCPTPAITFAVADWRPEAPAEDMLWFPFEIGECRRESILDVALCRPSVDLRAHLHKANKVAPVQFEWDTQPDGTRLAFTGFPLEARDPMTFQAHVAAYRTIWPDKATSELVLDHNSLPGFSGSPVYTADGKVVAILVKDGKPEAPGAAIARPVSAVREMLTSRRPK
jgi:hypothetical protein